MNRRTILKWLGLAPVAAAAPAIADDGVSLKCMAHPMLPTTPNEMTFETEPEYIDFSHDGTDFNPDGYECNDRGYAQYYEDKYWEAQSLIDELHEFIDLVDVPEPPPNATHERWRHIARTVDRLFIDGKEV